MADARGDRDRCPRCGTAGERIAGVVRYCPRCQVTFVEGAPALPAATPPPVFNPPRPRRH